MNATQTGTIRAVKEKGFGFIMPDDGGPDLFFHISSLDPTLQFDEQLIERRVTYIIVSGAKGLSAQDIRAQ